MSENEFEVLDELYFVTSYPKLKLELGFKDSELISTLKSLFSNQWIRVLRTEEIDMEASEIDWDNGVKGYFFLASKKGLFAHNSN